MPENERLKTGRATRTAVLGEAHVAQSDAKRNAFNADFLDFITEGAWGSVWSRPGLSKRDRSLLTIALMAALGHEEELAMHIRATRNTGASKAEVQETLLHIAVYAGVPFSNIAFRIAKEVYSELEHHKEP